MTKIICMLLIMFIAGCSITDLIWTHSFPINVEYHTTNSEIRTALSRLPNLSINKPENPVDINVSFKINDDKDFEFVSIVIWHYEKEKSIKLLFTGDGAKEPDVLRKKIDVLGQQIAKTIEDNTKK